MKLEDILFGKTSDKVTKVIVIAAFIYIVVRFVISVI